MRKYLFLFICIVTLAIQGFAQSLVRSGARVIIHENLLRNTLSMRLQRTVALEMRNYFLKPLVPTPFETIRFEMFRPSDSQMNEAYTSYLRALKETTLLAKTLDNKIFYQGTPERREFCPAEIRDDLKRIEQAKGSLYLAELFLKPGDPALEQAKRYISKVATYYQMCGSGMVVPFEEETVEETMIAQQRFDAKAFFLESPVIPERQLSWRERILSFFSSQSENSLIPQKLRVAVITDDNILQELKNMQQNEKLTGWTLDAYQNPEEFLEARNHLSYDLVLTDILVGHGGGIYLTRQLRHEEFKGGILALTAYPAIDDIGIKLQRAGMDGMIAMNGFEPEFIYLRPEFLFQKLRNYFFYKEQQKRGK